MKRKSALGAAVVLAVTLIGGAATDTAPAQAGSSCKARTSAPADSYSGTVVVADNFESGNLNGFQVTQSGTGTASVTSDLARSGGNSAYLHVTADARSVANFASVLPAGTAGVYADGWFDITQAGDVGNGVPYFRLFSGSTRFVDIYRYNSNGQLWLRVLSPDGSSAYTCLRAASVPLGTWHHVVVQAVPSGSAATVQVWFDGAAVYSGQVNSVATSVDRVLLGSEHGRQMGDTHIDDLIVKAVPR